MNKCEQTNLFCVRNRIKYLDSNTGIHIIYLFCSSLFDMRHLILLFVETLDYHQVETHTDYVFSLLNVFSASVSYEFIRKMFVCLLGFWFSVSDFPIFAHTHTCSYHLFSIPLLGQVVITPVFVGSFVLRPESSSTYPGYFLLAGFCEPIQS